jgi:hypothetical protein
MPETGKDEKPETVNAAPEEIAAHLRERGVVPSAGSAAGLAAMGSPAGEETAQEEAEGMDGWQPPNMLDSEGENSEAQSTPALFTTNGSLPFQHVASPSGPVPATTITDPKARKQAIEMTQAGADPSKRRPRGHLRVTTDVLARMSRAEVNAVATDRGYDVPERLGRRALNERFLKEQDADEFVRDPEESEAELNHPAQPLPVATAAGGTIAAFPGGAKEAEEKVRQALEERSAPIQQDKSASQKAAEDDEKASQPQKQSPTTTRGGPAPKPPQQPPRQQPPAGPPKGGQA